MGEGKKSRLAAIMFTDIAGYSSMMEQDENNTMGIIEEHNRILLPLIEGSEGKIVDAIGDGLLIVFDSVFSACNCALNIQGAIQSYNDSTEQPRRFRLRIGIHMGDIWQESERVYGNGVNIAARLLPLAEPGGICVSDDVHRQLRNKTDVAFKHLGSKTLKNIQQPVVCHQLITGYESAKDNADSDIVREKLSKALEGLREMQLSGNSGSSAKKESGGIESRLENRIGSFVETVIDRALNKWESVPQEKRNEMVGNIKKEAWYSDAHLAINHDKSKKKQIDSDVDDDDEEESSGKSKDESRELIPVGIVATAGFGAALIWFNALWLVFPLIFVGLMPLGIGLSRLIRRRKRLEQASASLPQKREGQALQAASRHKGRLSVMQMSAQSGLSLDQSQHVLDDMAKKGYIGQEIDGSGLIYYVFPELLESPSDETKDSSGD